MAIYVYRREMSTGARDLAEALNGRRYRGIAGPIQNRVRPGDHVIAWGEHLPAIPGVSVLNGAAPIRSKLSDAQILAAANVPTITTSSTRPAPTPVGPPPPDPAIDLWNSTMLLVEDLGGLAEIRPDVMRASTTLDGITELQAMLSRLQTTLASPPPTAPLVTPANWLPRSGSHVGGADLLNPPTQPDFWVRKENIVSEYRIHSFLGRSIRAGLKVPRTDPEWTRTGNPSHPWIRSWDAGWKISYQDLVRIQNIRDIAHAAIRALGLDFGAVDVGVKNDGTLIVLEVNRAPGLSDGTASIYANAINRWIAGELRWENTTNSQAA